MTLNQIECFILAAQLGSISAAAEQLFVTQQAASGQIRSLEKELGFELFERRAKGIALTREGHTILQAWEPALAQIKEGTAAARNQYANRAQCLRIACEDVGQCSEDIMLALAAYEQQEAYKGLEVDCQIMSPRQALQALDNDAVDLAIVFNSALFNRPDMNARRLHRNPLKGCLYFAATHPLAKLDAVTAADVCGETIGVLDGENSVDFERIIELYFRLNGVSQPARITRFASRRDLEIALLAGRCVTLAYESVFPSDGSRICSREVDTKGHDFWISLCWRHDGLDATAQAMGSILEARLNAVLLD